MTDGTSGYRRTPTGVRVWEGATWALLFAPMVWGMWMFGGTPTWSFSTGLALSFAGLAMVALRNVVAGQGTKWRAAGIFWWLAGLAAWVVARDVAAEARMAAMWDAVKWISLVGSVWAWMQMSRGGERWKGVFGALLLLLAAEALYGVWQWMTESRSVLWAVRPELYGLRLSGSYGCPNHFANALAMGIPLAAALLFLRGAGAPLRLLAGYYLALSLPVLYGTMSRSAWLGTAGGLGTALLCWLWRKNRLWFLAGLAAVPLGMAAAGWVAYKALPLVQQRVDEYRQGEDKDKGSGGRLSMWKDATAMWRTRPATGYGGGSFVWAFPRHQKAAKLILRYDYPHNEYIQTLVEYGAVGGGLLAACLAAGAFLFLRGVRRSGSSVAAGLLCGAAGSAAAGAIHAAFDFNFHIFANPYVLACIGGTAWGVWLSPPREEWEGYGSGEEEPVRAGWGMRLGGALLAVAFLSLGVAAARGGLSYWHWLKGEMATEELEWDDAGEEFRKAVALCGQNNQALTGLGNLRSTQAGWFRAADEEEEREGKRALAEEAETWYGRALAANPFDADAMYGMGRSRAAAGDAEGALRWMKEATETMPTYLFYQNEYAMTLRDAGRTEEAKTFLDERKKQGPLGDRGAKILKMLEREAGKKANAP